MMKTGGNEMERGQPKQRKRGQIGKVFRRPLSKDTRKWKKGGHGTQGTRARHNEHEKTSGEGEEADRPTYQELHSVDRSSEKNEWIAVPSCQGSSVDFA